MRGLLGAVCVVLLAGCAGRWVPMNGITVPGPACVSRDAYVRTLISELTMRDYPATNIQIEQGSFRVQARYKRGVIAPHPLYPSLATVNATTYFDVHVATDNRVRVGGSGHYVRSPSSTGSKTSETTTHGSTPPAARIHVILEEERQEFVRLIEKLTPACNGERAPSTEV